MLIAAAWLAVIALLTFALSFVAFLVQTSRHRSSGGWAAEPDPMSLALRRATSGPGGVGGSEGELTVRALECQILV